MMWEVDTMIRQNGAGTNAKICEN